MEVMHRITRLKQVPGLSEREVAELKPVEDKFVFRSNSYYDSLINWQDSADPIRKLIIPEKGELQEWGDLDASEEATI